MSQNALTCIIIAVNLYHIHRFMVDM